MDSLPEIGKVLSFGSIIRVAEDLNKKKLQSLEIAVLYSKIPEEIKKEIVSPYISVEKDEARVSVRIKDSLQDLRRNDLIEKINKELNTKLGLEKNFIFKKEKAIKRIDEKKHFRDVILEDIRIDKKKLNDPQTLASLSQLESSKSALKDLDEFLTHFKPS